MVILALALITMIVFLVAVVWFAVTTSSNNS